MCRNCVCSITCMSICTTWPCEFLHYLSFIVHYFYAWISAFTQFFIHKNCFELFFPAHFLLWEILNLNLTFAVYGKLTLSSISPLRQPPLMSPKPKQSKTRNRNNFGLYLYFSNRIHAAILHCTSVARFDYQSPLERWKYQFTIVTWTIMNLVYLAKFA